MKKIIFLEAGHGLSEQMEKFAVHQMEQANYVTIIDDCYNSTDKILAALKTKPDILIVETTFVYEKKIKALFQLAKYIESPIDLWIFSYDARQILSFIPTEYSHVLRPFDLNLLKYKWGEEYLTLID